MQVMITSSWWFTIKESVLGTYSRGGLVGLGKIWTLWSREKFLTPSGGGKKKIFLESLNEDFWTVVFFF
jgi:hypothetical protein